ncbi:hypothetical protein B0I72DRAFT_138631 [Yarrowia lipolytica]|nr:hypothetical protein BKA91DRAFT_135239 [Yarrowia lipolytica]KAE8172656.1 hypothetical protein BKA90DRAFT_137031 [Yarrowia lipolytica]RDW32118.1 hypothetical protein B0I72DRAFT_138631 [Yarrowia lipolytica]RMI99578.1 hypothetical protein BD777DRAFT_124287 [Yarrowia lipolytica]
MVHHLCNYTYHMYRGTFRRLKSSLLTNLPPKTPPYSPHAMSRLFLLKIFVFFFFTLVTNTTTASNRFILVSSMALTSMVIISMFLMCVAVVCKLYHLSSPALPLS